MSTKEFVDSLVDAYRLFAVTTSSVVNRIATVQRNHPSLYKDFIICMHDKSDIFKFLSKFTPDDQDRMILLFYRLGFMAKQMSDMMELSVKEKDWFAKKLEEIGERYK